jgi:hypothetical protein
VRTKTHSGHDHDHGYKRLFSHPQAVEELIRGFLRPDWVESLDLSTLERVGNELISDDLRVRRSDVIWRVRRKGKQEEWLYLLLELQSTPHPFMALRMLTYAGLLLEEVIRKEKLRAGSRLPTVLPVVFYNGKRPWRELLDLASLFVESTESLRHHLPRLRYLLLDEGRLDLDRPELAGNRVAALFRIETCKDVGDLPRLTRELFQLLPPEEEPELRRTIKILVRAMLRRNFPGVTIDLEDASMLDDTVREWKRKERKEGRQEGMRELLLRQIERRFGPLDEEKRHRFEAITSPARLKRLADEILTVSSLDEIRL